MQAGQDLILHERFIIHFPEFDSWEENTGLLETSLDCPVLKPSFFEGQVFLNCSICLIIGPNKTSGQQN